MKAMRRMEFIFWERNENEVGAWSEAESKRNEDNEWRVEWDKQRKQKQKGYEFIGCVLPSLHS